MMRLAIVSSPRCGNTWIREVLSKTLSLQEIALHDYVDAKHLPESCVLQIHWYREPHFQRFLRENHFKILVLARHPLDVLLSVLHFVQHDPDTKNWLLGNCDLPEDLHGSSPTGQKFLDYCLSFGAENLLSITYQWWHEPTAIRLRYEEFVKSPSRSFVTVAEHLGCTGYDFTFEITQRNLEYFKALPNHHGWQGTPNNWKTMIIPSYAKQIKSKHRNIFSSLGYSVPYYWLTKRSAAERWHLLRVPSSLNKMSAS